MASAKAQHLTTGNTVPEAGKPARLSSQAWIISGFWVLITMATALQFWLLRREDVTEALQFASMQWLPWALLTPLIFWFSSVFTLEREKWMKHLPVHFLVSVCTVLLLATLGHWHHPPPPPERGERTAERSERGRPPERTLTEAILVRATFQFPIFWAIVGVAHAFLFYERAQRRERETAELQWRLANARLQALRMQLNPHFLFNTLNSIASLVHDNAQAADEMIGALSDLLRHTLSASDRHEVTLREELEFLDRYLAIEQTRFGDRLRVEKQIEPATLDAVVPILILQPLVENALKHGVEARLAIGLVRIAASRAGDVLQLQVTDNGPGLKAGNGNAFVEGVGLSNTRARLQELWGQAGSLSLSAPPEGGLVAQVRIPWRAASSLAKGSATTD